MSKIYTKTGDLGQTSLFDGTRVSKADLRVECYGTVDELETWLGFVKNSLQETATFFELEQIQQQLFIVMSNLACLDESKIEHQLTKQLINNLESLIDHYQNIIIPITEFAITGSNQISAKLQVARTICRRAERRVVALKQTETVNDLIIIYLNRLGDLLYLMGSYYETNRQAVTY